MKALLPSRLLWPVLGCLALTSPLSLRAEPPAEMKDLLRDGLYKEEVNRDPEAAAKSYQDLLAHHDEERALAATAEFRLAEVRRKQGRKDEAIAAYRLLLTRFPEATQACQLAREALATLGVEASASGEGGGGNAEETDTAFRSKLAAMVTSSPDALPEQFEHAIEKNFPLSLAYLFEHADPPASLDLLEAARGANSLEIVNLLLKRGIDLHSPASGWAFTNAMNDGQIYILKALLAAGFDPNQKLPADNGFTTPLTSFDYFQPKILEAMLAAKADVKAAASPSGETPLHRAATCQDATAIGVLLAAGADPNALTAAPDESSPLDLALLKGGDDACLAALEKAGGKTHDPHLLAKAQTRQNAEIFFKMLEHGVALDGMDQGRMNDTQEPIIKAYLEHGGKVNLAQVSYWLDYAKRELALLAIEKGSCPVSEDVWEPKADGSAMFNNTDREFRRRMVERGWKVYPWDLKDAMEKDDKEELRFLFDHGADIDATVGVPLDLHSIDATHMALAHSKDPKGWFWKAVWYHKWDVAKLLMEADAPLYEDGEGSTIKLMARSIDPVPEDVISMAIKKGWDPPEDWLAAGFPDEGEKKVRSSIRALLFRRFVLPRMEPSQEVRWIGQGDRLGMLTLEERTPSIRPLPLAESLNSVILAEDSNIPMPKKLTIWRRQSDGSYQFINVDLADAAEYPALEWGDIVDATDESASTSNNRDSELGSQVQKHIAAKITVEVDGVPHEILLRGGVDNFDAEFEEARFGTVSRVVQSLWYLSPEGRCPAGEVTVLREGWPPRKCPVESSREKPDLPVTGGDRLILKTEAFEDRRPYFVDLSSPGQRKIGCSIQVKKMPEQSAHSNLQRKEKDAPPPMTVPGQVGLLQLIAHYYSHPGEHVLCFPDFSKVQIRRLQKNAPDKIIPMDLQAAMDALPADADQAAARALDVSLEPGDMVELPTIPHEPGQTWDGFTETQRRVFQKALSYTTQFTDGNKAVVIRTGNFELPTIHSSKDGVTVMEPEKGSADIRLSAIAGIYYDDIMGTSPAGETVEIECAGDSYPRPGWTYAASGPVPHPVVQQAPPPEESKPERKVYFKALPLTPTPSGP